MKKTKIIIGILVLLLILPSCDKAPKNYLQESAAEKQARMVWWDEAKFGMFIHWGLYAVLAGEYNGTRTPRYNAEWIMDHLDIPVNEYEKLAAKFNPVQFDANEWVSLAKNAGMKYIIITSKHHEGFCLWKSKHTDYDIMDASPFKRDILKELSKACKKNDVRLGFYYSIMDWHHPDAQSILEPNYNQRKGGTANPDFPRHLENYMKPQLKELLSRYGDIGVLWFDGEWIPDYTTEMGKEVYNYLRNIKPDLIINNRVDVGRQGMSGMNAADGSFAGDFGTPEQEIPATGVPGMKWESCMTMNDSWGYKYFDDNWKSSERLIQNLIDIASKGGNFLLNVGPTAEGLIPAPSIERLNDMGEWMKVNGEAIYGTNASPFERPEWGRYTSKENQIFAHVFNWPEDGLLAIPELNDPVKAWLMADKTKSPLNITKSEKGITIQLPANSPDPIASVIVLEKK